MKFGYRYANIRKIHIVKEHESSILEKRMLTFTLLSALGEDIYISLNLCFFSFDMKKINFICPNPAMCSAATSVW